MEKINFFQVLGRRVHYVPPHSTSQMKPADTKSGDFA